MAEHIRSVFESGVSRLDVPLVGVGRQSGRNVRMPPATSPCAAPTGLSTASASLCGRSPPSISATSCSIASPVGTVCVVTVTPSLGGGGEAGGLIGVMAAPSISDAPMRMGAGEALVMFTDGVTERHAGRLFFDDLAIVVARVP